MLNTQYSFLQKSPPAFARWLPQLFIALFLLLSMIWAFGTTATWDDDCPMRAYNALHAFSEPEQFISPWNRPLFILLFSLPVQLGFWTIPVLMSAIVALSGWAMYRALLKLDVPNAVFVLPLYFFQTFAFVIAHNALTEPLAMALIAFGFWSMVEKKWILFGLFGGLLVLARLELILLLPIWAFVLLQAKQYRPLLLLGMPFVLWNVAGGVIMGDWAYVFSNTLGAAGEESRYGQTPWSHYFMRYIYVLGPVPLFFMLLGLMDRIVRKQFAAFMDLQFVLGFMAYVVIAGIVAAGNSAGFLRNLIPVTPLVALLGLEGLNAFLNSAESKNNHSPETKNTNWLVMGLAIALSLLCALVFNHPLRMHMLVDETRSYWANAVFVAALGVIWLLWNAFGGKKEQGRATRVLVGAVAVTGLGITYTVLAEPPGSHDSRERQIMEEIGTIIQPELKSGAQLHVNHIWYFWSQGEDPKAKTTKLVTVSELDAAPPGAYVIWDLHYSSRLAGNVRHDYFDSHKEWTELLRYRTVEDNFMAMVFVKGQADKDASIQRSETYLSSHSNNPAAWSAAGNVRMRWGDFQAAAERLSKATQLEPEDPDALFSLGLAHLAQRQLPQAERALQQASVVDPQFPSVWFHLGSVHASMGNPAQAIADLNRCIELKPDYANAFFTRGAIHGQQKNLDAAIADFNATLSLDPNHLQARFNRGATYAMMRRHDLAVADLRIALKSMPNNADGWLFLGRSQAALNDLPNACAAFQKASQLNSEKAAELIAKYCTGN